MTIEPYREKAPPIVHTIRRDDLQFLWRLLNSGQPQHLLDSRRLVRHWLEDLPRRLPPLAVVTE